MIEWPQRDSVIRGRKTGNHYRIIKVPERYAKGRMVVTALGRNPAISDAIGKEYTIDDDRRDRYEFVWRPGDPFLVGDIVEGKNSKAHYRVLAVKGSEVNVTYVKAGGFRQVGEETVLAASGLTFIERPIPSTTNQPTTTTSEEDTNMDASHLTTAINNLAAEEAAEAVKPTYKRISKLVRDTKVGEVITTHVKGKGIVPVFYGRRAAGTWSVGSESLPTEQVIARVVTARVQNKAKVRRLVVEK